MLEFFQSYGVWGLFLGSFLSATVVPFSSDAIFIGVLLTGCSPISCLISATIGNWLGGLTSFGLGWLGKWEWIEKYFHVKRLKIERHRLRVVRYGYWLALLTWLPFCGDIFAIALGFYRLRVVPCALLMLVGKFARFLVWMLLVV